MDNPEVKTFTSLLRPLCLLRFQTSHLDRFSRVETENWQCLPLWGQAVTRSLAEICHKYVFSWAAMGLICFYTSIDPFPLYQTSTRLLCHHSRHSSGWCHGQCRRHCHGTLAQIWPQLLQVGPVKLYQYYACVSCSGDAVRLLCW